MADRIKLETFPTGDMVLEADNQTTFVQHEYGDGLVMGLPSAELSEKARAEAPDGALVSYRRRVDTPRVGVDGLREALREKYGERQQSSE